MVDIRRLPDQTGEEWEWQSRGACLSGDPALFFHPDFERGEPRARRVAAAKMICRSCPVTDRCRDYSLTVREAYGTWGGMDELERRTHLKSLRARDRSR